jgi:energy-coupling factor transporter ATP-binding protein EcfA2
MSTTLQAPPLPESPYPGIKSFRYLDRQLLTARKEETWNLLRNVLIYRGVLLYGDSGSGKSSLVNAGLIPAALKEKLIAHRLRIQPQSGKEIKIERIPLETEDKPPFMPSVLVDENSDEDKLLNLEIPISGFYEKLKTLKTKELSQPRPLLIFDQFEEFITLFEEALRVAPEGSPAQKQIPELQQTVLRILVKLLVDETLPVKCLFVFREDYLAKLNPLFDACPELLNQFVRLLPPRVEEAEEIIRGPFVNEDLKGKFTERSGTKKEISPELAKEVATQLQHRSDSGFINLSELQVGCRKLWDSSDPARYFKGKDSDIQKVVEDYWAGVLDGLGNLYEPAIDLLGHMVTSSNTRNIISEPDLKTREKGLDAKQIENALNALLNLKLVRREPRNKIYFYEIVSEFLVPWIQQKKADRLAELKARELAVESQTKLEQAEKRNRRLLIGAGILGLLLVVAIAAVIYAFMQRRQAREAQAALQGYKDGQVHLSGLLDQLTSPDPKVRLNAVNGLITLHRTKLLGDELVPLILALTLNDSNPDVSKAASYFFDQSVVLQSQKISTDLTASILQTAEKNVTLIGATELLPRVYIQVAGDSQRARASLIANELRKNGFTVPGFQLVDNRHAPINNELRYYASQDESKENQDPNVEKLLKIVNEKDNNRWTAHRLRQSTNERAGHYELWFGRDSLEPDGILKLIFTDEEGNRIWPEKFRVTLKSQHGLPLISRDEADISVPPGKYSLKIQVPDYEVYESNIEITSGEDTSEPVRLQVLIRRP